MSTSLSPKGSIGVVLPTPAAAQVILLRALSDPDERSLGADLPSAVFDFADLIQDRGGVEGSDSVIEKRE